MEYKWCQKFFFFEPTNGVNFIQGELNLISYVF